jgi:hypothetical protein
MTIQYRATTRNAKLDAIQSNAGASCAMRLYTGAQPANCATANSGTLLVTINLPNPFMAAAAAGAAAKSGTWSGTASGGAGATAGHFRLYSSQATMDETTCFMQGGSAIGSGDLNMDGTITSGQTITINTFTITDGNP